MKIVTSENIKEKPLILFKVLRNMQSCNGGDLKWKLGEKYTVKGKLTMCEKGFHLTVNPQKWIEKGCRVYFAEAYGVAGWQDDKCLCASVVLCKNQDPNGISEETLMEFNSKRDAFNAEFNSKRDALDAEFNSKRDALYAEFKPKRDALNAEFNSKRDALDAEFKPKRDALDAEFNSKRDAFNAEFNSKRDALDAEFKPKWDALYAELRTKALVTISELQL